MEADGDALIVRYNRELLREHVVSDAALVCAEDDARGLTELTATIGYYGMLACVLNTFEARPADAPSFES